MERDSRKEFLKNITRFVVSERMCWGYFTARRCGLILGEDVDIQIAKKSSECFLVSNDTWYTNMVSFSSFKTRQSLVRPLNFCTWYSGPLFCCCFLGGVHKGYFISRKIEGNLNILAESHRDQ